MKALRALVLSLLLHMLIWWGSQYLPVIVWLPKAERIELEVIDAPDRFKDDKTVVRETPLPDSMRAKESDDPLRFWSNQTQTVKRQTRAPITGMTKNRANDSRDVQKPAKQKEFDPFALTEKIKPPNPNSWARDVGMSTVGEALPDNVQIGEFTALNTDKFIYYSFYARLEELIRFRWENGVHNAISRIPESQFQQTANQRWVTQIEVTLTKNGKYHRAQLMKPSGIPSFDQAAIQAFVQAKMFPNPPEGIVGKDGYIRLKYAFSVDYNPTLTARRSSK